MSDSRKILVIEDDDDLRRLLTLHLSDLGLDVRQAADGLTGLDLAMTTAPELIVLDLKLPGMDGLEVCRRVRQTRDYIPILMLTSRSSETDRVVGLEMGADDYLTKPFGVGEFLARVKAMFRRGDALKGPREEPPEVMEFGEIRIERAKRRVTLNGEPVALTVKEFDLLALFRPRAGTGLHPRGPSRQRLGAGLSRVRAHREHPHQPPARQDRAGPRPPALPPDRVGGRLPPRGEDRALIKTLHGRLTAIVVVLFAVSSVLGLLLTSSTTRGYAQEERQRLNLALASDLARYLKEARLLPVTKGNQEKGVKEMRRLMTINPSIDVYVLDQAGRIVASTAGPFGVRRRIGSRSLPSGRPSA